MKHRGIIHCGSCARTTGFELGGDHIVTCQHCGARIRLCDDGPIDEHSFDDLVAELGGVGVLELMRQTALSEVMHRLAAELGNMPCGAAEAILSHVLWYLTDYKKDGVNMPTILKLLRLCELGGAAGAREGWLIGPVAQA